MGGDIHKDADLMVETKRRVPLMRACYTRLRRAPLMRACYTQFTPELHDMTIARLSPKARLLTKAEVIETPLCGRVTWTLLATHNDEFRRRLGLS